MDNIYYKKEIRYKDSGQDICIPKWEYDMMSNYDKRFYVETKFSKYKINDL